MLNTSLLLSSKKSTVEDVLITADISQGGAIVFDKSPEDILQGESKTVKLPIGIEIIASYRDPVISGELFILDHSDNIYSNTTHIFRINYPMEGTYLDFGDLY